MPSYPHRINCPRCKGVSGIVCHKSHRYRCMRCSITFYLNEKLEYCKANNVPMIVKEVR